MKRNLNWLDRIMLAVTFAEAGCAEEAQGYLAETGKTCGCNVIESDGDRTLRPVHAAANNCR